MQTVRYDARDLLRVRVAADHILKQKNNWYTLKKDSMLFIGRAPFDANPEILSAMYKKSLDIKGNSDSQLEALAYVEKKFFGGQFRSYCLNIDTNAALACVISNITAGDAHNPNIISDSPIITFNKQWDSFEKLKVTIQGCEIGSMSKSCVFSYAEYPTFKMLLHPQMSKSMKLEAEDMEPIGIQLRQ